MSNVIEQIKVGSTTYKIVDPVTAQLICDNVESGTTASKTYTKGEYVRINGTLYKVTANIATGQAMTVGVNIAETNVGDELSQLNTALTDVNTALNNKFEVDPNGEYHVVCVEEKSVTFSGAEAIVTLTGNALRIINVLHKHSYNETGYCIQWRPRGDSVGHDHEIIVVRQGWNSGTPAGITTSETITIRVTYYY